jgi:hypothetical protein
MNKLIKELAIKSGLNSGSKTIEGKYKEFDLEKFTKEILLESHSIWWAMDNGNYCEGFIEMEDFPRAVLKRFKVQRKQKTTQRCIGEIT